jgi:hypothetical protein
MSTGNWEISGGTREGHSKNSSIGLDLILLSNEFP